MVLKVFSEFSCGLLPISCSRVQANSGKFWQIVEKATSCVLNSQRAYLILVDGHSAELQQALGGKQNFCDGRPFTVGGECFFTFQPEKGMQWVVMPRLCRCLESKICGRV